MKKLVLSAFLAFAAIANAQSSGREQSVAINSHPIPSSYVDLGPAPASLPAGRVMLFLNRAPAQQAQLDVLIREQADPASPEYHHYLTPAQFGQRFGPSDSAVQAVAEWLAASGFTNTRLLSSRLAFEITANAPELEVAFQTHIHQFADQTTPGKMVYGNASPASVPASLAPYIKSVSLSNIGPRPMSRPVGSFVLQSHPQGGTTATLNSISRPTINPLYNLPGGNPCAPTGVCYALVPGDVATIYDTKPVLAAGIDGAGITIGIAGTSNIDLPTVQRFRTLFLPKYSANNLPNVIIDGQDPGLDGYGSDEAYIDVETAGSVAPNATINFYIAANSIYTNGLTLALTRAVEDNSISLLSVSYGECEAYLGSYNAVFRDLYEEAAAQGITVLNASGDTGAASCDPPPNTSVFGAYQGTNGLYVDGLASTPYDVAVGGTDFLYPAKATAATFNQYWTAATVTAPNNNADWSSALSYIPEKPWADSDPALDQVNVGAYAGGGGGHSSCAYNDGAYPVAKCQAGYPKPAWQQGFGNDQVRDLPDVSFFSGIGSNYSFYAFCTYSAYFAASDCAIPNAGPNSTSAPIVVSGFGGTSVATPLMAGILALVAQKTQTPRLGLATPTLYPLSRQFPAAFHDITTGTNAMACVPGSTDCGSDGFLTGYAAGPGYDLASGLGSLDAAQVVAHWASVTTAAQPTSITLALTPTSGPHETVVTFKVNVTGTSGKPTSGTIAIFGGATPLIQTVNECAAFPCSFTYNGLPGGTYPVTARFIGDGTYASSTSAPVTVTISPEPSEVLLLNPFNNNMQYPPNGLNGVTNVQLGQALGFLVAPAPSKTPANTSFFAINWPPPTGSVVISDNGVPLSAPVSLSSSGIYSFLNTSFALGSHSLTVKYLGDSSYGPSDSTAPLATPISFTVIKAVSPAMFFGGLPSYGGVAVGTPLSLFVYVGSARNQNNFNFPDPSGTITLTVNGTVIGPFTQTPSSPGQVEYIVNIPANLVLLGTNTVEADYPGDANYAPISAKTTFQGIVFKTYASIGAQPTATSAGRAINFYLAVFRDYNQAVPTSIPANIVATLLDGSTQFATVSLAANPSGQDADATYPYSGLSVGTHVITLQFAGDAGDLPSSSSTSVVISPGVPGITLSGTPVTFAAGVSAPSGNSTLTVTPLNGFTGSLTLSCSASALPGGSCTLPTTVNIAGSSPISVPLTILSNGKTAYLLVPGPFRMPLFPTAFACLMLGFSFTRKRGSLNWRAISALVLASSLLMSVVGCGAGNFQTQASITVKPGTYNVTVTATSGMVTSTTSVPVTVQ